MVPLLHYEGEGISPGLVALGGAVVGGLLTFLGQYLLQRGERRELARRVAAGLLGEIAALVAIAERRNYVQLLRAFADSPAPEQLSVTVTRNYFKVFDANTDKIGLLGPDLPEPVAGFYVRASAALEDFAAMSDPSFMRWGVEQRRAYYRDTAALLEETLALGLDVLPRLRAFAQARPQ